MSHLSNESINFKNLRMWKPNLIKILSEKFYSPSDIYDANAPLFFCFKWFGVIPLEQVYKNNVKSYKVSKFSKFIKYLAVVYTLVIGTLFITNVLRRQLPLVDQKTIYFAEAYGISVVFISVFAMLASDSESIKRISKWYFKLSEIDKKYYINEHNIYKNVLKISWFIIIFLVISYLPLTFTFLYKIYLSQQIVHLLVSLMYQIGHFRSSFILYLLVNGVYILQQRFKIVNENLTKLSKDNMPKIKHVYTYLDSYNKLRNMLDEFNSIYGIMRAACLMSIFSEISYGAFIIITQLYPGNVIFSYSVFIMYIWWEIGDIVVVTYSIYMCEKCLEEVGWVLKFYIIKL